MRPLPKFRKGRVIAVTIMFLACASAAVAGEACAACHPKEVQGFLATPMAQSMGSAVRGPSGSFFHDVSQTRFSIESSHGEMRQRMERDGLSSENSIAYSVGSGTHAVAYLVGLGNHLFQSPLSYYVTSGWGMSPGYERLKNPDFDRAVRPQCLFCHAGEVRPIADTLNAYEKPPFAGGISCERCHGPSAAHLRSPVAGSIINPAKLEARARDSVCEQCHLDVEVSIPNPGKEPTDFRAGERLEDVYTVYVYKSSRDPAKPNPLTIISQSQQLAVSQCALHSADKLWCGTCHDPHAQPKEPVAYYRDRCLSCHGATLLKSHASVNQTSRNQDCVSCHMPRLPVGRGAHTIFTDHRIGVYTPEELAHLRSASIGKGGGPATSDDELVPWRNPPAQLGTRNLGLAYALVGRRLDDLEFKRRGYELLLSAFKEQPMDAAVLRAMGNAMTGFGDEASALAFFAKVLSIKPNSPMVYHDMAFAATQAGRSESAIEYLEKTLQLDPLLVTPYKELARLYTISQQPALARETYERFLKVFPESLEAKKDVLRSADARAGR